jgi:hypothetical protein
MKRIKPIALVGVIGATMVVPTIADASTSSAVYNSTPVKGTVSVPSQGPEAYSFSQIGNEVILRPYRRHPPRQVTMVSCRVRAAPGRGFRATTPGATFKTPITLNLYRSSTITLATGEVKPGSKIMSVTKTFAIHYRPSSASATVPRFWGNDGELHNGLDQTITFPMNRKLGSDVVWTVSYNTANHGPSPLGVASETDSLNVGLAPSVLVGHDRFPDSIFWDTTVQGFTCADPTAGNGGPFVTGELNRDGTCNGTTNSWAGYVPAVRFSTR